MNDSLQCGQRSYILKLKSKNKPGLGNKLPVLQAGQCSPKMEASFDFIKDGKDKEIDLLTACRPEGIWFKNKD
jgi:hypothetical protein